MQSDLRTNWEADRLGLFRGTPSTPGEALDSALGKVRKRPVPRIEPLADAWPRWEKGEPYIIADNRLDELINGGRLPPRSRVTYQGANPDRVEEMVESGAPPMPSVPARAGESRN